MQHACIMALSSPEPTILLVCARDRDLCPPPTPDVRDSRTHCQIWQIWLVDNYRTSTLRMLINWERPEVSIPGADQKDLGLFERRMASWVQNAVIRHENRTWHGNDPYIKLGIRPDNIVSETKAKIKGVKDVERRYAAIMFQEFYNTWVLTQQSHLMLRVADSSLISNVLNVG